MDASKLISAVTKHEFNDQYKELHWSGNFRQYLDLVIEQPAVARTAFQRVYDMISSYGYETYTEYKKEMYHWRFFDDPLDHGKDAVFGLDIHLNKLVNVFKAGAAKYGPEKRVILLHGPVGSAKSTIARMLKKGLQAYSASPAGALYTYEWTNIADILSMDNTMSCPMHEEPLHLIPGDRRR